MNRIIDEPGNGSNGIISILDEDAPRWDSGTVPARRVQVPWGDVNFDFSTMNSDGQDLMKRALLWAAGLEDMPGVCGDTVCDPEEDACTCPSDCGVVMISEFAGVTCQDNKDNDCDGNIDCLDADCFIDPACFGVGTVCGNAVCESGESCLTCGADCDSRLSGAQSSRFCCGNGVLETAEGDASVCDGNP